jgi:hypothetical protein
MSEQEEREGVKRGATGGQEDGRATSIIRERAQKGSEGWQNETEGTRGNSVLHKKGVEELLHADQTSCTCTMAKCMHAAGGHWAVEREEEGGREKRREEQAGQTLLGGQVGCGAHPPTQQKQEITPVPPPPFTSPDFALERRGSELATRDVVVVNTES